MRMKIADMIEQALGARLAASVTVTECFIGWTVEASGFPEVGKGPTATAAAGDFLRRHGLQN